jgi:hypothetical protein
MNRILTLVDEQQRGFAAHPFFARMEQQHPYEDVQVVVPQLAFWVLTFHDLLELCEGAMLDPELRRIVRHHRGEESGHDAWYLRDLQRLGVPLPDPVALFGEAHQPVRRASYALMAEAIRSESDWVRIALVLMMEATGAVFFTRAAAYQRWPAGGLEFFSGHHLAVEQAHELFEQKMRRFLAAQTLTAAEHAVAEAAVRRGFAAFGSMFDGVADEAADQLVAK